MLLDIDFFKRINDTHGHQSGDEVLVTVAAILNALARTEVTVARVGGEEFAMLLPDTNLLGTAVLAERVRVAIEKERFILGGRSCRSQSVSALPRAASTLTAWTSCPVSLTISALPCQAERP